MNIDGFGIFGLAVIFAFIGFILTLVWLALPLKDDLILVIELLDCETILEHSFDFKMPQGESYYRDECL